MEPTRLGRVLASASVSRPVAPRGPAPRGKRPNRSFHAAGSSSVCSAQRPDGPLSRRWSRNFGRSWGPFAPASGVSGSKSPASSSRFRNLLRPGRLPPPPRLALRTQPRPAHRLRRRHARLLLLYLQLVLPRAGEGKAKRQRTPPRARGSGERRARHPRSDGYRLGATTAGDLATVFALMSDDAVFLVPGQPPMYGKRAFAEAFQSMVPMVRIEATHETREIQVRGDIAWCWSYLSVKITPRHGGQLSSVPATRVDPAKRRTLATGGDSRCESGDCRRNRSMLRGDWIRLLSYHARVAEAGLHRRRPRHARFRS